MENQQITHIYLNSRYRIVFEKASGVKTGDGFKVEANGDDLTSVQEDAELLYNYPSSLTEVKNAIDKDLQ